MHGLIVLFNLKPGVTAEIYENWAQKSDLPTMRSHGSVDGLELYKTRQLFGTKEEPPFQYIEVIRVKDAVAFSEDLASAKQGQVRAQFQEIGDDVVAIWCDQIG